MNIVTPEELAYLQQASARADAVVSDLLQREKNAGMFLPKLRTGGDIGDYVVPPILSWQSLDEVVRDPTLGDIDYSIKKYPHFDGIIDQHFNSDEFTNPINARYEKWANLRHNIACVRNFLMIHYFEQNPHQIPENDVEENMEEIAKFIGKGCYNNYLFLGFIPNHNPLEDFIDLEKASAPDGDGARYIYERILAKNRSSTWMKPFDAVVQFFTGSSVIDWQLPPTQDTPFDPHYALAVSDDYISEQMVDDAISESNRLRALLAETQAASYAQAQLQRQAVDLDALGNHLLYGAASAHHVVGLSDPVRRDAVEIAKDILRKLKVSIGGINIKEGLRLSPEDDVAAVAGIKGVMMVFEKMLANARGSDASVLNHPAVISAMQAFGQIGYLAKLEAFRFASRLGDSTYASMLAEQLRRIPDFYASATHNTLGELLNRIDTGIDIVRERTQQMNSPESLLSLDQHDNVGSSMDTPTAGLQSQIAAAIGVQGNMQAQQAQMAADQAARTQAARLLAEQARKNGQSMVMNNPVAGGTGRSALAEAKKKTTITSATPAIDPRSVAAAAPAAVNPPAKAPRPKAQPPSNAPARPAPTAVNNPISPLVLQAMQQAQLKMGGVTSSNAPLAMNPATNSLKSPKTPNTKADALKEQAAQQAVAKQTAQTAQQIEEARRAQAQQAAAAAARKPTGRSI